MSYEYRQSPNYTQGRGGKSIEFIVCHWIVGDVIAADAVFSRTASQVSAHYAVKLEWYISMYKKLTQLGMQAI